MSAPLKISEFPKYFKHGNKLLSFISKDEMYKIEPIGSNNNPGVTIDHYMTRNMVLKHWPFRAQELTSEQFKKLLQKLFSAYIEKIV